MRARRLSAAGLAALLVAAGVSRAGDGQEAAPPALGKPVAAADDPTAARIRALEEQNRLLMQRLDALTKQFDAINGRLANIGAPGPGAPVPGPAAPDPILTTQAGPVLTPTDRSQPGVAVEAPITTAPQQLGRPIPQGLDVTQTEGEVLPRARVDLEQGVRFLSPDSRFRIELHDLTQVDFRAFSPSGNPLVNSFVFPRQRFYFAGQIGDDVDFVSIINRGYGTFDLLDVYMNYKLSTELNFRIGRTKTPYDYEYFKIAAGDLIAPERSVFVSNLSPNRQIGAMAFGRLFDQRLEYATGVFNGPHRSFEDFNNAKDMFFFINARPFLYCGDDRLQYLNFSSSLNFGRAEPRGPLEPNAFRTSNDETTSAPVGNVSPTFLTFRPNVVEVSDRAFWAQDVVWFYRGLTFLGQYNGGFSNYVLPKKPVIHVPYEGFAATLAYFLTGEEPTNRREILPLRPFRWRQPGSNPGAVEVYHRTAYFNAGTNVFKAGLADPTLWSHDAWVFDTGINWYMNRYVRIFLDWQHSEFSHRVQVASGRFTNSEEVFWLRTQVYY